MPGFYLEIFAFFYLWVSLEALQEPQERAFTGRKHFLPLPHILHATLSLLSGDGEPGDCPTTKASVHES